MSALVVLAFTAPIATAVSDVVSWVAQRLDTDGSIGFAAFELHGSVWGAVAATWILGAVVAGFDWLVQTRRVRPWLPPLAVPAASVLAVGLLVSADGGWQMRMSVAAGLGGVLGLAFDAWWFAYRLVMERLRRRFQATLFAMLVLSALGLPAPAYSQEAKRTEGYLRETIEKLPPAANRDQLIAFLDQCRAVSDRFLRAVASGDAAAAHALLARDMKAEVSVAQWSTLMAATAATYGAVAEVEYRNQALETSPLGVEPFEAHSTVWYAATTTPPSTANPFAIVKGVEEEDGCFVVKYELMSYGDNVPAWIAQPRATAPRP